MFSFNYINYNISGDEIAPQFFEDRVTINMYFFKFLGVAIGARFVYQDNIACEF